MTAIERLRRRLGPTSGTVVRAFFDLPTVISLLQLHEAVDKMSRATCISPRGDGDADRDVCIGQHHASDCPAMLARRVVLDLSSEIEGMP